MSGRVTDESGAVLPGVTVTATHTGTSLVRTAVTDETGAYVLPNMPAVEGLFEGDQMVGVRTGDKGIDRNGHRKVLILDQARGAFWCGYVAPDGSVVDTALLR